MAQVPGAPVPCTPTRWLVPSPDGIIPEMVQVVVASGFLAWVDVWGRDELGDAGAELDGPVFFVDQVVVM